MPTTIENYDILETLGNGAYGKVKLARKVITGQLCAVKIISSSKPGYHRAVDFFFNETQDRVKLLDHTNIVKVEGYSDVPYLVTKNGRSSENMFIALELAERGEMFDYMNVKPFDERTARFYFRQLIDAVEYLHNNGVVNRDLKLENLLLDINYNLKIADFGFSAPVEGRDGSGLLHTKLGTPSYQAPEVAGGAYDG